MIEVRVDLSGATPDEVRAFYELPGVARAVDSLAHPPEDAGVRLRLVDPPSVSNDPR